MVQVVSMIVGVWTEPSARAWKSGLAGISLIRLSDIPAKDFRKRFSLDVEVLATSLVCDLLGIRPPRGTARAFDLHDNPHYSPITVVPPALDVIRGEWDEQVVHHDREGLAPSGATASLGRAEFIWHKVLTEVYRVLETLEQESVICGFHADLIGYWADHVAGDVEAFASAFGSFSRRLTARGTTLLPP